MGSRAMYLYSGGKDTLFRIHGTNQPEYIGASISSGCIRMTNEDVIDLYNRVKMGTIVVVLEPKHGDSPYNSKMALQGGGYAPIAVSAHRFRPNQTIKSAGFAGAFLLAACAAWTRLRLVGFRVSACAAPDSLPAWLHRISRRPRAAAPPPGRSAGSKGAIPGSGSYTFHWQIR